MAHRECFYFFGIDRMQASLHEPDGRALRSSIEARCGSIEYVLRLPHRQASALERVRMDEIVAVFGHMRGNGGRRRIGELHPETVRKHPGPALYGFSHVPMFRKELRGEILEKGRAFVNPGKAGSEQVPVEVLPHMEPGSMVADTSKPFIEIPVAV